MFFSHSFYTRMFEFIAKQYTVSAKWYLMVFFYTLKRFHIGQIAYSCAPPEMGHIFRIITNSRQLGLVKILNLWNTSFIEYIMASVALSY